MSNNQDDIMAFLDAKFGSKPHKKPKKDKKIGVSDTIPEPSKVSSNKNTKLDNLL
jgi:hypothetical protein